MTMWAIGERIVCIDDGDDDDIGFCTVQAPVLGRKYTIRDLYMADNKVHVLLNELRNGQCYCQHVKEGGFFDWRFELRPSKSMEILRNIASDPPKRVTPRKRKELV